jgi:putative ABC transport system ATP-binding protein
MDIATRGRVLFDGNDITHWNEDQLCQYRRNDVGFVFQFYNLVPNLTALENVELAAQICTNSMDASETLEKVGLRERINNFPSQLSGGEQQRVSIARALAKRPKLLLCDEPTGALDYVTGKQILKILQDTCRLEGITVIIITHNSAIASMADKVFRFRSGKVVDTINNEKPIPISEIEW